VAYLSLVNFGTHDEMVLQVLLNLSVVCLFYDDEERETDILFLFFSSGRSFSEPNLLVIPFQKVPNYRTNFPHPSSKLSELHVDLTRTHERSSYFLSVFGTTRQSRTNFPHTSSVFSEVYYVGKTLVDFFQIVLFLNFVSVKI